MQDEINCNKSIIANHSGLKIVYCETHKIAELILGGISLRLDLDNLQNLKELLNMAYQNLHLISGSQNAYEELMSRLKKVN